MYNEYPERIYVDRGIDASTAALLNKDNNANDMWPWMAMMNGGMGGFGNGGWWMWILILLLGGNGWGGFGGWGRNGFGNFGGEGGCCACTREQLSTIQETIQDNHNADLLMSAIKGSEGATRELAGILNADYNALTTSICAIQGAIKEVGGQVGFSAERVINAVNAGDCNVIQALKDCCCQTQQSILKMGYENQIATLNQTNQLTNSLNSINTGLERGFSSVAFETSQQTCAIKEMIQDSTAQILAGQRAAELREMQNKIDSLRDERTALQLQASQQAQTANLINQIKPCPIPAYITCNPYDSYTPFYGYNNGYVNGGCCA